MTGPGGDVFLHDALGDDGLVEEVFEWGFEGLEVGLLFLGLAFSGGWFFVW